MKDEVTELSKAVEGIVALLRADSAFTKAEEEKNRFCDGKASRCVWTMASAKKKALKLERWREDQGNNGRFKFCYTTEIRPFYNLPNQLT